MASDSSVRGTDDQTTRRIRSLDGLRGLAALVVVLYHCLLVTPSLWDQIAGRPVSNPAQWVLAYTPLRIVWAGGEAVWIFFVLSGFVLVRPYLADRSVHVGRYYLRRALRLYVPFFGSFVLAVLLHWVQTRPKERPSGWIFIHEFPTTTADAVRTLFLFAGDSTTFNDVWWSLRWEVWFSALLPLVVIVARRYRHRPGVVVIICLAVIGSSNAGVTSIHLFGFGHANPALYLPMFGLGVALAMGEQQVTAALEGCRKRTIVALAVGCSAALTSTVAILAVLQSTGLSVTLAWMVAGPIGLVGAAGLVALALCGPGLREALSMRPITWLGERSYTLYLIHEPILVSLALLFGLSTLTWWWIPFGVAVSLLVTAVAYQLIERPVLRLIRRIPAVPVRTVRYDPEVDPAG